MNRKQRDKNRATAQKLYKPSMCPECGQPGHHFVPPSLGEDGFFVCDKFYGPDGRRLPEYCPGPYAGRVFRLL